MAALRCLKPEDEAFLSRFAGPAGWQLTARTSRKKPSPNARRAGYLLRMRGEYQFTDACLTALLGH